jgi:uncharacterized membrane protein (DUF2068 family)
MAPKEFPILRAIAIFEMLKGLLVLIVGLGVLDFVSADLQDRAASIIATFQLNPARLMPKVFLESASHLSETSFQILFGGALLFVVIHLVLGLGLWRGKTWAPWVTMAILVFFFPFDGSEIWVRPTTARVTMGILNFVTASYLAWKIQRVKNQSKPSTSQQA